MTQFFIQHKLITPHRLHYWKILSDKPILTALNDWTSALDNSSGTDVIFLDFQKAFDTVPHCRLIKKLDAYGIKGSLLFWIKDFLSEHTQQVVLNGSASNTFTVSIVEYLRVRLWGPCYSWSTLMIYLNK